MEVKFKKLHNSAQVPKYAKEGDAGLDLVATSIEIGKIHRGLLDRDAVKVKYGTGLAVEIPKGYVGLLFPRSSIAKKDLILSNSVGVIDSGYRGEIIMKFIENTNRNSATECDKYEIGERIGQLLIMPYPKIETIEVKELSSTDRGEGGFGSTGK